MPLTEKGNEILGAMQKEYGAKKGEEVFYAAKNAGTISGVDSAELGLEGKSITVLDGMAEQIASLGSEAKRLAERMDASRPLKAQKKTPTEWVVWFEGDEPISQRTIWVVAENEKQAIEKAKMKLGSSGFIQ
jgi:hypothetical protein